MKKLLLIILFLIIPYFVYADECNTDNISIKSITLSNSTNGVIEKSDPIINGGSITLDLSMSELNDKIEYNLIIENKSKDDYELKNINGNSDYIVYSISTSDNSKVVKANSQKSVILTVEYKNEVSEELFNEGKFNDNKSVVINLSSSIDDIINPKTGYKYAGLIYIAVVSTILVLVLNNKEFNKTFIILLLACPLIVKAACNVSFNVSSNIEILESKKSFLMSASLSNQTYLRTNIEKQDIEKIIFVNSIEGHSVNGTTCFDVSKGEDEKVLAWVTDSDSNGKYELTIGSNGKVYLYSGMILFSGLENLESIDGMKYLDTSNVSIMNYMFSGCSKLQSLDLSHFNTSKVKMMMHMFKGCSSLTALDLSSFDTSNVTRMNSMFSGCTSLTSINLSSFNTSRVTSMESMFSGCTNLTQVDVSSFDTSKVKNLSFMFDHCENLISLNLNHFNTSQVTTMVAMFQECNNLESLKIDNFDTSNVVEMNHMFNNCFKLAELKVSSFDTSKVTTMRQMFYALASIESLDVSSFDTSNVTDMAYMFNRCWAIKTIYASDKFVTTNVTDSLYMFLHDEYLIGGAGTTFGGSGKSNAEYAHIDGGTGNPGYFTSKTICKRATTLHSELCTARVANNELYCNGAGLYNKQITYGSLGTSGTLTAGDAFDCDVNADGVYDSENERFYYVSPKDADVSSEYVTLLYYSPVNSGVADPNIATQWGSPGSMTGPNLAAEHLPTKTQWKNYLLVKDMQRQIRDIYNNPTYTHDDITYNLPLFTYTNRAARLLTYRELIYACGNGTITSKGYLDNCMFVMEKTKFSNTSYGSLGIWLETHSNTGDIKVTYNGLRTISSDSKMTQRNGVKPAIEVLKSSLVY